MGNINPEGSYGEVNKMKERIGDVYKEPEKRDVMGNINPEGSYNEVNVMKEKAGDMDEKPEKRDVMGNINPNGKYILTKKYVNMIIRRN